MAIIWQNKVKLYDAVENLREKRTEVNLTLASASPLIAECAKSSAISSTEEYKNAAQIEVTLKAHLIYEPALKDDLKKVDEEIRKHKLLEPKLPRQDTSSLIGKELKKQYDESKKTYDEKLIPLQNKKASLEKTLGETQSIILQKQVELLGAVEKLEKLQDKKLKADLSSLDTELKSIAEDVQKYKPTKGILDRASSLKNKENAKSELFQALEAFNKPDADKKTCIENLLALKEAMGKNKELLKDKKFKVYYDKISAMVPRLTSAKEQIDQVIQRSPVAPSPTAAPRSVSAPSPATAPRTVSAPSPATTPRSVSAPSPAAQRSDRSRVSWDPRRERTPPVDRNKVVSAPAPLVERKLR